MADPIIFWTKVGAIGQVAGAAATFLAVLAALSIATSERRFRLRVTAKMMAIHTVAGATPTVSVEVENIGNRTTRITGLYWATGYRNLFRFLPRFLRLKSGFQMIDYEWFINDNFPWTLQPGESKSTHFRRQAFLDGFAEHNENDIFRRLPLSKRYTLVNFRVGVGIYTRMGVYYGTVDRKLKVALEDGYQLNAN